MRQREQHREMAALLTLAETARTVGVAQEIVFDLVAEGKLGAPTWLKGNGWRWACRDVAAEAWILERCERVAAHRARRGRERQPSWATPAEDEAGR